MPRNGEQGNAAGRLRELQQALTDLRDRGLGKAKSAAIDGLRESLIETLRNETAAWNALRELQQALTELRDRSLGKA